MKLLFHCCCGPCSIASVESLIAENIIPTLFWYNPNIHPLAEYESRHSALTKFSSDKKLSLITINEYGQELFTRSIGAETEKPGRCVICYRLRLEKTAVYAVEQGFDAFSTSLLISPYQQNDTIRNIGEELTARYGVTFLYRDFRPLFRKGQADARALGMYMQKYCGCIFSREER